MSDKPVKPAINRADLQAIMEIDRAHAERLKRLKEAILTGDTTLEHQLAREVVGLPPEGPPQ